MHVPARVWIPVLTAVGVAGLLVFFLWWQLSHAAERISEELKKIIRMPTATESPLALDVNLGGSDRALLRLRQGDLFALQGEWADAEKEYEEAMQAGGGIAALRKLAQAQLQRRNIDGVRGTIRRLKQEGARPEDVLLLGSIVHLRTGELVKAKDALTAAEDSPQKHYGLALLSIVQGVHEQAQTELAQVISGWDPLLRSYGRTLQAAYDEFALFPEGQELHLVTLLSRALAETQECELALPLLLQVLEQQDDYRDAWIVQGFCELVTERPEQALVSLERAYAIDPEKPEVQYFLARAHAALNDHRNAITFFQYALQNGFKPEKEIRRLLAREATELGNADLAIEQYRTLANGDNADLEVFEKLVTMLMTLEKKEDAYVAALKAVAKWPEEGRTHDLLGWAAAETDRKEEAKNEWTKALELDPDLASAKERLEKL